MKSIRLRSPSKINIFLRVLGKRLDGYHEIETLFQQTDFADEVILRRIRGGKSLDVLGAPEIQSEDNIVFRAVKWLESLSCQSFDVKIELHKNIPIASGLGGGSSNAAATIVGIKELFDLDWLDLDAISPLTAVLGADVPFFFHGGSAIGEGIGENLTQVCVEKPDNILLVNPGFPVSTAKVFEKISKTLTGKMKPGILRGLFGESRDVRDFLHNDLQTIAERMYPPISSALNVLRGIGIEKPLMSGSGPTIFGLLDEAPLKSQLQAFPKSWKVIVTRPAKRGITIN
ncbi:MAG: 4-(cytidine 5'-diphospho)-2-C-methyl-D-erythritol kinase [Desulfomonilaceae bacterium]